MSKKHSGALEKRRGREEYVCSPNDGGLGQDTPPKGSLNVVWSPSRGQQVSPPKPADTDPQQTSSSGEKDKK